MNRLTARNKKGFAYYPQCFQEPCCGSGCQKDLCGFSERVCETLAAYEETGLTPDQIRQMDKLYGEKCQEVNELKRRISESHRQQEWIPVEEQLPDEEKVVLVSQTYSWENFEEAASVTIGRLHSRGENLKPYWEFQYYRPDFKHGTIMDNDIICPGSEYISAWMPLPEPYKP